MVQIEMTDEWEASDKFCFRCLDRVSKDPTYRCMRKEHTSKCILCVRLNHACVHLDGKKFREDMRSLRDKVERYTTTEEGEQARDTLASQIKSLAVNMRYRQQQSNKRKKKETAKVGDSHAKFYAGILKYTKSIAKSQKILARQVPSTQDTTEDSDSSSSSSDSDSLFIDCVGSR